MGGRRKMELPYRRYSVPETVMRKYWMSRERAGKVMVDKSAQTEWRPCVVWTEASSTGRSASEPSLYITLAETSCRPVTAPSTPTWTSSTLPPPTTSDPTSSTSTSLPSTDPGRLPSFSPRPPPNVQVLCIHHDVCKADVMLQFPEIETSSSEDHPMLVSIGVNTESPKNSPEPLEETVHDIAVQTGSPTESPLSKLCQTNFTPLATPSIDTIPTQLDNRCDFSCQVGASFENPLSNLPLEINKSKASHTVVFNSFKSLSFDSLSLRKNVLTGSIKSKDLAESSCTGNYKEYPGLEMVIPRYSAYPRTGSMVVNMSSIDNSSDSDLSLADSLEDPVEKTVTSWPQNKLDKRLVRGEVSQATKQQKTYIKSKNTYAYFLFLSGEEDSIKENKLPESVKERLRKKEEEIKKVYEMKLKKMPMITYKKRKKMYKLGSHDECQTYTIHSCVPDMCLKIHPKKSAKAIDISPCECVERKEETEKPVPKNTENKQNQINTFPEPKTMEVSSSVEKTITSTISQGSGGSQISVTLTVPKKNNSNEDLNIDEKVAKVLLESLEEIREQTMQSTKALEKPDSIKNLRPEKTDEKIDKTDTHIETNNRLVAVQQPSTSFASYSEKEKTLEIKDLRGSLTAYNSDKTDKISSPRQIYYPSYGESSKDFSKQDSNQEQTTDKCPDMVKAASDHFLKITEERRQAGTTLEASEEQSKESHVEDEELLRAILKKSMQPHAGEWRHKGNKHSEVCELGLKFLSNEIDIDQFIAGIPLERIEQDVKRLMYKHYLGTSRPSTEDQYEHLMKKKMVVSFVDEETSKKTKGTSKRNCNCKIDGVSENHTCEPKKINACTQINETNRSFDSDTNGNRYHQTEKSEKCLSPLDKSVATAVQTIDSFLDSERLPVINEMDSEIKLDPVSITHCDNCKYFQNRNINSEGIIISESKPCFCKYSDNANISNYSNLDIPNNHLSISQHSFYSPRPVKTSIKNNLHSKSKHQDEGYNLYPTIHYDESFSDREKKKEQKKSYNEVSVKKGSQKSEQKVDKVKSSANLPDKYEKRGKLNITKKGIISGNKFTQMFEVIPEEHISPNDEEHERKHHVQKEKSHHSRSDSKASFQSGQVKGSKDGATKKSVSTMVNLEGNQFKESDAKRKDAKRANVRYQESDCKSKTKAVKGDVESQISRDTANERKPVVIGRFRSVQDNTEKVDLEKKDHRKVKASSSRQSDEDLLSLSKGWINFYLVRDNQDLSDIANQEFTKHEYSQGDQDIYRKSSSLQKSIQTQVNFNKQVQLPNLPPTKESKRSYKSSSDCSNISLPEIRSSSSSTPSSPDIDTRKVHYSRQGLDTLPDLRDGYMKAAKKKKKLSYYNEGDKSDSGPSAEDPRITRRVEVSHSEHSVSSVTSSTVVMSESPVEGNQHQLKLPERRSRRSSRSSQHTTSNTGSCWTVTVAGSGGTGNEPPPDVEMRLCFASSREESAKKDSVRYSHKAAKLALSSTNHHEIVEEKPTSARSENRQYALETSSGSSHPKRERSVQARGIHSRIYVDNEEYRQRRTRRDANEEDWNCEEMREEGPLHVTGCAITPEEKPRVPTQSERDLVRAHRYKFTR